MRRGIVGLGIGTVALFVFQNDRNTLEHNDHNQSVQCVGGTFGQGGVERSNFHGQVKKIQLDQRDKQEINVGNALKLLEKKERNEIERCVFGSHHDIGRVQRRWFDTVDLQRQADLRFALWIVLDGVLFGWSGR